MSKTDKTRPYWVRLFDQPQNYLEAHDHVNGVCDLPDRPAADSSSNTWWGSWLRHECGYTWSAAFCYSGEGQCGCRLCTGYHTRREERRRDRHDARRKANDWLKEFRSQKFDLQDW